MIKLLFTFLLFATLCYAERYPKLFAQMGTPLYEANSLFKRLSDIEGVNEKSIQYHFHAQRLLAMGLSIENNPKATANDKQNYVKALRELQKDYDEIMRIINGHLLQSIDANDYAEFTRIMDYGIDAILQNSVIRKRTMAYYVAHRTRGRIATLDTSYQALESDAELMAYVKGHMPAVYDVESTYTSGGTSKRVLLSKDEDYAYVADGTHCFKSVDIKNFADASEASSFSFYGDGCDLVDIRASSTGDYLYLSDEKNGFTILDMALPYSPLQKGEYPRLQPVSAFPSEDDNTLFIIRKTKGLSIFDISNKNDFKLLANYNRGLAINHLALDDNRSRLYLSHDKGISVLDISLIGNPREVASFTIIDGANNIILSPDKKIAYVASGKDGVHVLDISSDQGVSFISTCLTPKYANHLTISQDGKRLYVSALDDGVYYINTEDSKDLRHISTYKIPNGTAPALNTTLNKAEDTLFISYAQNGIAKVKLQDR